VYRADVRRTAAAAALAPFWLAGFMAAAIARPLRWAGAAVAEGYDAGTRWKWTPALGLTVLALVAASAISLMLL